MKKILFKIEKFLISLFCGVIPSKAARNKFRANPFGYGNILFSLLWKNDHKKDFKHDLAIACIAKNEGLYVQEWIEYHLLVGVSKFYFYDNGSTDNTRELLEPYIQAGILDFIDLPGKAMQRKAYELACENYKNDCRWLAIIDLDEFLVSKKYDLITDYLKTIPNYAQVSPRWFIFGDSGLKEYANELVIARFIHRGAEPTALKSIVNPRAVKWVLNHTHTCFGRSLDPNSKDLRINHYWVKTWEEYLNKISRGGAWNGTTKRFGADHKASYDRGNRNEVLDTDLLKYVPRILENMSKRKAQSN